ncbi:ATP-dependent translocase ABCB1-like [Anticarsia gemmatalis]|uniref:ATP-dependent translocase ABCB1-like n=1 Tax=Anticarsia gemmatalis TaxID=129554 RepID=UPI003F75C319
MPKTEKGETTAPSISFFTLFRFTSICDKIFIVVSVLASVIAGITYPFAIVTLAQVFQDMISYQLSKYQGKHDDAAFLRKIYYFGIKYSSVGVLLLVTGYIATALMNLTAINQIFKLRQEYLKAVLNQDFAYFDLHLTTDFASKMADDVTKLEEGIGEKVSTLVFSTTVAISCITMALLKGWKLALLCLITLPVTLSLVGLTGLIADRLYKKEAIQNGLASAIAQEVLSSIRTVYAFNGQRRELERYRRCLSEARRIFIKKEIYSGISMCLLLFCVFCSYALSFYFGVYLMINDPQNYNADVMFSVFIGVMAALGSFSSVGPLVQVMGVARGAGAQIYRVLDNVPTINPLLDRGLKPPTIAGRVEFKNVHFSYPSRPDVPVIKGINLTINPGDIVAIVGHSGSGKSTVITLISRYYDVSSGSVYLDGTDVRELSVAWLRSQMGHVRQEPVLFNTTVRENIRFGKEDATNDEIETAAKQANAHKFIVKLPKGYETTVGERGTSMSGGQKQRIAIARALVRQPRLLLLDEATSALDTASEAKVRKALDKAAMGRTTIIVAHRLSTIRHATVIHVMKDGEVVESGTHDELIEKRGLYHDMVGLQQPIETAETKDDNLSIREESKESQFDAENEDQTSKLHEESEEKVPKLSYWSVLALKAKDWKWMVLGILFSIVNGFSMPLFIVAFGDLFKAMSDPNPSYVMAKVEEVSLFCMMIGIVIGLSNLIEILSFGVSGAHMTEDLRGRMFEHLLRQQVSYFDEKANSVGALCTRLSAETSQAQRATGQRLGLCFQGIGSVGLALVLAMWFEWRVGLVALAFVPLAMVVFYYQSKAAIKESFSNAKALEDGTKVALEAVSNVRTVAALGRERGALRDYARALAPALGAARRGAHVRGLVAGLSRSMFNFMNTAAISYGGHLIVSESIDYHAILITTQSLQLASIQAQNAFMFVPDIQRGVAAASRIMALLNSKPTIYDPASPAVTPFVAKGEASLKDVMFTYPTRPGTQILRGIDLQIESGKTIALVGASGCGKSTVIQLLQRFYDADAGTVNLDGIPLPNLLLSEARGAFGLVSQEPTLFDYSIEDNIKYGDNSRSPSHQEVVEAAKQANIHDFIVSLPLGYDTNIGAKGTQLSGGQKQRIAIARALIRQPKILLLDEATSALDTESEKVVQAALDAASTSRTCVSIAHRLSTVRHADLVCVLRGGVVAEAGTHQELIDRKGLYYQLHANAQ